MLNTKKLSLINTLAHITEKGVFSFTAVTEQKALKKSRSTKEPTPDHLLVLKKVVKTTVSMGNDYQKAVNNRLNKNGLETDFKSQGSYCSQFGDSGMIYKHNDKDDFYLRVYPNLCHSFSTEVMYFDLNNNYVSPEEFEELREEYFKKSSSNKSQGLDDAIIVNNYKIDNIVELKRGNFYYSNDTVLPEIKEVA